MGENCARLMSPGWSIRLFEAGDEALQKLEAPSKGN
jgi:hypothetical protein